VELRDAGGAPVAEAVHLPTGQARPLEADLGLAAAASPGDGGSWDLGISTRRFAQWVVVEVPGYEPSDSWFHLPPGGRRTVCLEPGAGAGAAPSGQVRALNATVAARIVVEER